MPTLVDTIFTRYDFTEREFIEATIFTDMQIMHIRTEIAVAAQERAKLAVDPEHLLRSGYTLEYLRGKIEALEALLATSIDSVDSLSDAHVKEIQERNNVVTTAGSPWVSPADAVRQAFGPVPDVSKPQDEVQDTTKETTVPQHPDTHKGN